MGATLSWEVICLWNKELLPRSPSITSFQKGKDAQAHLTPGIPPILHGLKLNTHLTTHSLRSLSFLRGAITARAET